MPRDLSPSTVYSTEQLSEQNKLKSTAPCEETDKMLAPVSERPSPTVLCASRREFIQELRRREFGCGAKLSTEATDLVRVS